MTEASGSGLVPGWRSIPGPADRDTFFAQQARYRRETWKLTALCLFGILLMGIPLSIVVSPLVWSAVILASDVVNLFTPSPDLAPWAFHLLDRVLGDRPIPPANRLLVGGLFTAAMVIPGMLMMLFSWLGVLALFRRSGAGAVLLSLGARDPRPGDLEEHRLVNIVSEMAIAAGVTPPRVVLLDTPACNAAAVGPSLQEPVIVVSRGLLDTLDRDETEGVIGHLVGSVGNGDLHVSLMMMSVVLTMGLVETIISAPTGPEGRRALFHLVRFAVWRRARDRAVEEQHLLDLLEQGADAPAVDQSTSGKSSLLDMLKLPFIMASGAFWMNEKIFVWLIVGPLIAATWRARKYLADATAVQLTRYPDGLARGLARLATADDAIPGAAWSSHLFVVGSQTHWTGSSEAGRQMMEAMRQKLAAMSPEERMQLIAAFAQERAAARGARTQPAKEKEQQPMGSFLSFDPPFDRRLAHLRALGATVEVPPRRKRSPLANTIIFGILVPLGLVLFALLLGCALALVVVTLAIYMLFLLPVVGGLHWLFRFGLPAWLAKP